MNLFFDRRSFQGLAVAALALALSHSFPAQAECDYFDFLEKTADFLQPQWRDKINARRGLTPEPGIRILFSTLDQRPLSEILKWDVDFQGKTAFQRHVEMPAEELQARLRTSPKTKQISRFTDEAAARKALNALPAAIEKAFTQTPTTPGRVFITPYPHVPGKPRNMRLLVSFDVGEPIGVGFKKIETDQGLFIKKVPNLTRVQVILNRYEGPNGRISYNILTAFPETTPPGAVRNQQSRAQGGSSANRSTPSRSQTSELPRGEPHP
jgi:hypothetical protein